MADFPGRPGKSDVVGRNIAGQRQTSPDNAGYARPGRPHLAGRRGLAALAFTQITGWGVLFYAFPVLQGSIVADTGWSATAVAGAFTTGQVVAALGGVAVGRLLDARGPRGLMTAGSALGVAGCVLVASAGTAAGFALAWIVAGLAQSACLYGPAFAAVTRWYAGRDRIRALTALTVVGGLASTAFAPLTAWLHSGLDWRDTYLVLAAVLALTVPAHWWGLRRPWPAAERGAGPAGDQPAGQGAAAGATVPTAAIVTSARFLVLGLALSLTSLCAGAVVVGLIPLLQERGLGVEEASAVLALGGIGQVAGRLGHGVVVARLGVVGQGVLVVGAVALTTLLLGVLGSVAGLLVVVLAAGAARGSLTLLKATAVADRWGTRAYARLSGALTLPTALAGASAPWVGARLAATTGSHATAFAMLGALAAVAGCLVPLTRPGRPARRQLREHRPGPTPDRGGCPIAQPFSPPQTCAGAAPARKMGAEDDCR